MGKCKRASHQDLADHFSGKMSLPEEKKKQVPPLEQPGGAKRLRSSFIKLACDIGAIRCSALSKSWLQLVGPDGVSPHLLKHCAKELACPLAHLFQKKKEVA